ALLDATNAVWRTIAVYSLSLNEDRKTPDCFERALKDSNGWVRAAAVLGLSRTAKDRLTLEQCLGPLLADADKKVVQKAALCLLDPETRAAAGVEYQLNKFEFEKLSSWSSSYEPPSEQ